MFYDFVTVSIRTTTGSGLNMNLLRIKLLFSAMEFVVVSSYVTLIVLPKGELTFRDKYKHNYMTHHICNYTLSKCVTNPSSIYNTYNINVTQLISTLNWNFYNDIILFRWD